MAENFIQAARRVADEAVAKQKSGNAQPTSIGKRRALTFVGAIVAAVISGWLAFKESKKPGLAND